MNVDPSIFPYDYRRFVTQDQLNQKSPRPTLPPSKPFKIKPTAKSEKSKKDIKKEKEKGKPRPFE